MRTVALLLWLAKGLFETEHPDTDDDKYNKNKPTTLAKIRENAFENNVSILGNIITVTISCYGTFLIPMWIFRVFLLTFDYFILLVFAKLWTRYYLTFLFYIILLMNGSRYARFFFSFISLSLSNDFRHITC